MRTPEQLAQAQLDAYNAKDLDAFVACYSQDVRVWRWPQPEPTLVGLQAFADAYRSNVFSKPAIQAQITQRIVMGNKVVDHERVSGKGPDPVEVIAVYDCADGAIHSVVFFSP